MQDSIPQHIGRYEVISLLGQGGMARAYLVVNRGPAGFNKLAVIKQILPNLARDAEFVTMFLDEARLAARLHHPNIVQTFDVAENDGIYLLAMEYLEGQPLSTIFKRIPPRTIPIETHLWILTQVLTGLHYAHSLRDYDGTPLGVVHRDVSPGNVLVTYDGEVKLLDFGVAKARGALASDDRRVKGKPGYCAPEQLSADETDARADVFAAGVLLWEVLAGRRRNRSATLADAVKARLTGKEPKIRDVRPDIDPALANICDRALAVHPAERFATAAEFNAALQTQLDRLSPHSRLTLIELLDRTFSADRTQLRRLIEMRVGAVDATREGRHLAETPTLSRYPPVISAGFKIDARPRSSKRLIVSVAVVVAATAAGFVELKMYGRRNVPASTALDAHSVAVPAKAVVDPLPVPGVAPAADKSPPPQSEPPAIPSIAESTARATPVHYSVRPAAHGKKQPAGGVRGSAVATDARGEARSVVSAPADSSVPASTSPVAGKRSHVLDELQDDVEPGTHLVRPSARRSHGSIYEKDPYSP